MDICCFSFFGGGGIKISLFQQNLRRANIRRVEVIKLGHEVNIFFLNLDDIMDGDSQLSIHTCTKLGDIHLRFSNLKFIDRNMGCLTYGACMPSLRMFALGCCPNY